MRKKNKTILSLQHLIEDILNQQALFFVHLNFELQKKGGTKKEKFFSLNII